LLKGGGTIGKAEWAVKEKSPRAIGAKSLGNGSLDRVLTSR